MPKFRKKPVVIEAVQWDGWDALSIANFMNNDTVSHKAGKIYIKTLEGTMTASKGDWIIKGVNGEFYLCKPDIFNATYEPVEPRPMEECPEKCQCDIPTGVYPYFCNKCHKEVAYEYCENCGQVVRKGKPCNQCNGTGKKPSVMEE